MPTWLQNLLTVTGLPAVLFKVTVLLAVAWGLHFAFAQRNRRWRMLVWRTALAGIPLLLVTELGLPKLQLPIFAPPSRSPAATVVLLSGSAPTLTPVRVAVDPSATPVTVMTTASSSASAFPPGTSATPRSNLKSWLLLAWGLGAGLLGLRLFAAWLELRRLLRQSQPAPEAFNDIARAVAAKLKLRSVPALRVSYEVSTPFAAGLAEPVVVLPDLLVAESAMKDLAPILAHEFSHIKSRDLVWITAARVIAAGFWFHPLVWPISKAHNLACEEVCDGVAAELSGGAPAYSRTLATTFLGLIGDGRAQFGVPFVRPAEITRRLRSLAQGVQTRSFTARSRTGFLALTALALLTGGGIALTTKAQLPPASPPKTPEGKPFLLAAETDPAVLAQFYAHGAVLRDVVYSPDGSLLTTIGEDGNVRVWKTRTQELIYSIVERKGALYFAAASPDGKTMARGGKSGDLTIWNSADGKVRWTANAGFELISGCYSPDGARLVTGHWERSAISIWDAPTGRLERELPTTTATNVPGSHCWTTVAYSPNGRKLATVTGGLHSGTFRGPAVLTLWDPASWTATAQVDASAARVYAAEFSPDNELLVTGGADNLVKLWPVPAGALAEEWRPTAILSGHRYHVRSIKFSPDGGLLATASDVGKGQLVVWSLDRGGLKVFERLGSGIHALAFSPDGKQLAAANRDGTVTLWDVEKIRTAPAVK